MKTVNSFFCGAGGFDLGFIQAGFEIAGAWDFDKYAVESYRANVGDHVKQADISQMTWEDVAGADVWTYGFPCQDLSNAGKMAGLYDGKRSRLFFEVMRLLDEMKENNPDNMPKIIMAENVKGLKKYLPVLKEEYAKRGYRMVFTIYNSKHWDVPQNRQRYFVAGIRNDLRKEFNFPKQTTEITKKLVDILENEVDEKYYMSDIKTAKIIDRFEDKFKVKQATKQGYDIAEVGDSINISHPNSKTRRGRVGKQIAQTLLTGQEQLVVVALTETRTEEAKRIRSESMKNGRDFSPRRAKAIKPRLVGIGNCCTATVGYEHLLMEIKETAEGIQNMYVDKDGIGYCADASYYKGTAPGDLGKRRRTHVVEVEEKETEVGIRIRKLTPREYARLQGFPDDYKQVVSNAQFYKQMGNAVSVTVAYAIAKAIGEQL